MKNNDKEKTKEQLINELKQMRRRIIELETLESNYKKVGKLQYENEERYRELADSISDVFFAMDKDLRYTYWNKASEKLTGIAGKDAIGKSIFDIFPDTEDTRRAVSVYREVLNTQESQNFVNEYQLRGKTYFFEISAYPSKNGISVFVKDITERKKAEEELAEYRKQLHQSERLAATGRLAASIAHEINNPLQAISFNLEFVKSTVIDDFKEKSSIEQVEIGTKRIKNTVKQLLDIHRGKVETKEIVNVNNIIEATLNLLKNQLMINNIEVKKSLSPNIPLITGITQELYQVFMNLIMNAQDAMEKGGILNISTDVKDNKLRIIFEDNGCGIPEEDMEHIFEPFFTTKSAMLGTGLGLSISKGIIESFGGNIDVKSKIGEGSSFTITFPIYKQKGMVDDHG